MKTLLHPAYFGPITHYAFLAQATEIIFENEDHYQKQTLRNRCHIYGANGRLSLHIPIKHDPSGQGHQKYNSVQIENDFRWQLLHWRSIETAYRRSPFFEYYEADLNPLFTQPHPNLLDYNYACMKTTAKLLGMPLDNRQTETYEKDYFNSLLDGRPLIRAKGNFEFNNKVYDQVFQEKHGFLANLSILDLLFSQGPQALPYLQALDISQIQTHLRGCGTA